MTDDDRSKVAFHRHDAEMEGAFVSARETFRFFWREVAWEKRRIVKAWDLVSVKAAFGDDNGEIEHMWLSDVEFDGQYVSGALQNTPLHVNARKGDQARVLPSLISDWLLGNAEEVCGGYTVHLLRTRMTAQEQGDHDRAWGLGFGDPSRVNVFPRHRGGGLLRRMFAKGISETDEHPMSVNMAGTLRDELAKHPSMATEKDDRGWTLLHDQALAGSAPTVKVLLEAGADRNALTDHGMTPVQLARSLRWEKVVAMLER